MSVCQRFEVHREGGAWLAALLRVDLLAHDDDREGVVYFVERLQQLQVFVVRSDRDCVVQRIG